MCGICGIVNIDLKKSVKRQELNPMVESLRHRGPDAAGVWTGDNAGLGHTRLSIIDLSEAAGQPIPNEDETVWLAYNGEIYNFRELRDQLEAKGHRFRSRSDTEVIVHLYEEEGVECVKRLMGMFSFALWDRTKKILLLARDRLGQKPLYYFVDSERLVFASEIKGILASMENSPSPDLHALYRYLVHGYAPHPDTGFNGIKKLSPGHTMLVVEGKIDINPYWSCGKETSPTRVHGIEEARQEVRRLLTEAVRIRLVSDVPLGVLLSGGIDSSAVAAMMALGAGKVKTFTIGFEEQDYDERGQARFLADMLGTEHHEMVLRPEVRDLLPKLVLAYDEPFADPSAVPSYYVAMMAREHVTVVLNGDGGDESFAGYGHYIQGKLGAGLAWLPSMVGRFLSKAIDRPMPGKAKSIAQVLALSGLTGAELFSRLRQTVTMSALDAMLTEDFKEQVKEVDPLSHLVKCYDGFDGGDIVNTMLATDRATFLPDDLLFKIDIAAMTHGLEARSPFLDHHLVEFAAGLPGRWKLNGSVKKYILKESLAGLVPDYVLNGKKRGFDAPVGSWLRNELKDLAWETVFSKGLISKIFKRNELKKMLDDHLAGTRDRGRFLWKVVMLHQWAATFMER